MPRAYLLNASLTALCTDNRDETFWGKSREGVVGEAWGTEPPNRPITVWRDHTSLRQIRRLLLHRQRLFSGALFARPSTHAYAGTPAPTPLKPRKAESFRTRSENGTITKRNEICKSLDAICRDVLVCSWHVVIFSRCFDDVGHPSLGEVSHLPVF